MPDSPDTIAALCAEHPPLPDRGQYPAGTRLEEWELTAFIGHGGNGEVYCAKHVELGTPAAVKILVRTESHVRKRFRLETKLLSELKSSSFPQFYSFGELDGVPYLVMELLEQRELPHGEREVAGFLLRICAVVAELHAKGFVHRDIKPSNILWRGEQPVLADFGLLKDVSHVPAAEDSLTRVDGQKAGVGTPGYAAPEQIEWGEATPASDIHALGVLADTCFDGNPPKTWLPIIQRATSSIPSHRYSSVSAFARAIRYRNFARYRSLFYPILAALVAVGLLMVFRRDSTPLPVSSNMPSTAQPPSVKPKAEEPRTIASATTESVTDGARYCVVDLSGGSSVSSYPVTYLRTEPAGWTKEHGWPDEYKTTKLVLRRIEAGRYKMMKSCNVMLTNPFYMGVFEVTQKQYQLVTGNNPSKFWGDKRPVESLSYNAIRGSVKGAQWPTSSAVDADSFLGKLRARTGLEFDLPTEAQWEYACRVDTTSKYNNGGSTTNDMNLLGRYTGNFSDGKGGYTNAHTSVGSYLPNKWGLYDMHGNVWEWCADWDAWLTAGIDPKGPSSGKHRVVRGGGWKLGADGCSVFARFRFGSINTFDDIGFRLARTFYPPQGACIVSFDANGGVGEMASQVFVPRKDALSPCAFTRTDYTFAGWATNANGAVVYRDSEKAELSKDVMLYAVWKQSSGYCVIDLSAGASATNYPVTYLAEPPNGGFNMDTYKMTKLVLRRIEAGTYIPGGGSDESIRVTLTKPFYMGIFEVTQKQYELVTGTNPSGYKGFMRPVEQVSYNVIRGASNGTNWPSSSAVDATSFMGKIRARTGLNLDLPTEAQWEYACRVGTTSKYNNGGSTTNDLKQVGRYRHNHSDGKGGYSSYHTTVGSYQPNAWGLYDMHGNVWEWCLDWFGSPFGTDPKGAPTGKYRAGRGGSWMEGPDRCISAFRNCLDPSLGITHYGFRLVCNAPD
ncbi:MAG: SUMF1/EgtB/PvdO family nonheme iron enzyme [Kiritimatiellae bacterium]|nr:SUMF1/EgtB/PvdO family nonheme iron enzyme [Kiritimatiellia bacterium]